jgi:ABC-type molybdenum transport system ATPase subunit/photorepair protein PhrA
VVKVPTIFICDEPEAGLHRHAEHRMAKGLPELARARGLGVVAATHSPDL